MTRTLNIIMEYKETTERRKLILNSPEHLRLFLIFENSPEDYAGDIPALLTVVPTNASLKVFKNNNDILSLHWRKGDIREVVAVVLRADPKCEETLNYWPNLHEYAKLWQSERKSIIKSLLPAKSKGDAQSRNHADSNGNSASTVARLARERRNKQDNRSVVPRNAPHVRPDYHMAPIDHAKSIRDIYPYPHYVEDGDWEEPYPSRSHMPRHPHPHPYPYPFPPHIGHSPYPPAPASRVYGQHPPGSMPSAALPYPRSSHASPLYHRDHMEGYNPLPETMGPEYPYRPGHSRAGTTQHSHDAIRPIESHRLAYDYPLSEPSTHHAYAPSYDDVAPHYPPASTSAPYQHSHTHFDVPSHSHLAYSRSKYHPSLQLLEPPFEAAPRSKTQDLHALSAYSSRLDKLPYPEFPPTLPGLFPDRASIGPRNEAYNPPIGRGSIALNPSQMSGANHSSSGRVNKELEHDLKPSVDTSIIGDPTTTHTAFSM